MTKTQITGKPTAEGLDLSRESRKATPKGDAYEPTLWLWGANSGYVEKRKMGATAQEAGK